MSGNDSCGRCSRGFSRKENIFWTWILYAKVCVVRKSGVVEDAVMLKNNSRKMGFHPAVVFSVAVGGITAILYDDNFFRAVTEVANAMGDG